MNTKQSVKRWTAAAMCLLLLGAADATARERKNSASNKANAAADEAMYQPVNYVNKAKPGPSLVVIPGEIKSTNIDASQKITPNAIADWAELELSQANFGVLERSDLGPMMNELALAVNMGDVEGMKKFKKGKFETTKWFVRFDILKAEPVAAAKRGFNGRALGAIAGGIISATGGRGAYATDAAVSSIDVQSEAQVWLVGMRYKIIDGETSKQVATGYKEAKMELGAKSRSVLGGSGGESHGLTLDGMIQRLVQASVADIDANNK